MNRNLLLLVALGATTALMASTVTIVDAREVAVVTAFGKPVRSITQPGLVLRAPWPVHEVVRFDGRVRMLQVKPTELLTRDKKNLVVEAFVAWQVTDPERFLEAVGSDAGAELQLSDVAALGGRSSELVERLQEDAQSFQLVASGGRFGVPEGDTR